jgi:hypothetical protein
MVLRAIASRREALWSARQTLSRVTIQRQNRSDAASHAVVMPCQVHLPSTAPVAALKQPVFGTVGDVVEQMRVRALEAFARPQSAPPRRREKKQEVPPETPAVGSKWGLARSGLLGKRPMVASVAEALKRGNQAKVVAQRKFSVLPRASVSHKLTRTEPLSDAELPSVMARGEAVATLRSLGSITAARLKGRKGATRKERPHVPVMTPLRRSLVDETEVFRRPGAIVQALVRSVTTSPQVVRVRWAASAKDSAEPFGWVLSRPVDVSADLESRISSVAASHASSMKPVSKRRASQDWVSNSVFQKVGQEVSGSVLAVKEMMVAPDDRNEHHEWWTDHDGSSHTASSTAAAVLLLGASETAKKKEVPSIDDLWKTRHKNSTMVRSSGGASLLATPLSSELVIPFELTGSNAWCCRIEGGTHCLPVRKHREALASRDQNPSAGD